MLIIASEGKQETTKSNRKPFVSLDRKFDSLPSTSVQTSTFKINLNSQRLRCDDEVRGDYNTNYQNETVQKMRNIMSDSDLKEPVTRMRRSTWQNIVPYKNYPPLWRPVSIPRNHIAPTSHSNRQ